MKFGKRVLTKVWPGLFFLAAALAFHLPPALNGQWPVEDDTKVFFFPLLVAIHDALRAGHLPLWTPLIFSGYPLFADGEGGVLYPLNLLVLPWLRPEVALVVLAVVHSSLAGLFTYGLSRELRVSRPGALLSGLVYAFCGFAVGQMVHMDVTRAMVWLPLELLLAERSTQSARWDRYRWTVLTGVIFGIQALALHIQVTLLSGLAVTALLFWNAMAPARGEATTPSPLAGEGWGEGEAPSRLSGEGWGGGVPGRLRRLTWALVQALLQTALIGVIGVGFAAVQLLPLAELAGLNYRVLGLPQQLAEVNTVWPGSLITLLLPRLFDIDSRDFWGPWVKWETAVYVGIVPLVLSIIGLALGRARHRAFFGVLAVGSLLAAMGSMSPLPVWGVLHQFPFIAGLESPGRFALLFSMAMATLAGYGADALWRRAPSPRLVAAVLGVGALVPWGGMGLQATSLRLTELSVAGTAFAEAYLHLPGVPTSADGAPLTPARVTALVAEAMSPQNVSVAWQLGLALGVTVGIALLLARGRLRVVGPILVIALTSVDLWQTGLAFHPWAAISALQPEPPPALVSGIGLDRVLTLPTQGAKDGPTDPNRLLAAGIPEAAGYSSLEPDRHLSYLSTVMQGDDDLLDLWNVRYIAGHPRVNRLLNYRQVIFDADVALFLGKKGDSGRTVEFAPAKAPASANALAFVAELRDAQELVDGEEVAQVRVKATDGREQLFVLRAGNDVSDARGGLLGELPANHLRGEAAY
ncbi:MAG TPA: hypothetical protein VGK54_15565, partial [Chloroflexota bacterium]